MSAAAHPARVALDLRRILRTGFASHTELKPLIWARLQGARVGPAEEPSTLLADFVRQNHRPVVAAHVRRATSELLDEHKRSSRVEALGELCVLAAAICSAEAVAPLQVVVTRPDAPSLLVRPWETLRHRAFRSLVALLVAHPDLAQPDEDGNLRNLFHVQSQYEESRILALTALIGFWPEGAARVRGGNVRPEEQDVVSQMLAQSGFAPTLGLEEA